MDAMRRGSEQTEADRLEGLEVRVRRARRGGDALAALLGEIRPTLLRWALMQTGDPDRAEDVAQEVLVRVSRSLDGYRGDARFATWLYRVLSNVVRDQDRSEASRHRLAAAAAPMVPRNPLTAPDPPHVERLLSVLMEDLSPGQRTAFDLVDLQGFSGPEAALMQEMNEATFRVHLARARAVIREAILAGRGM